MTGYGVSGGALSVVNAIPSGYGGAFGIGLTVSAEAEICSGMNLTINHVPADTRFLSCLMDLFRKETGKTVSGVKVAVTSSIPAGYGLKSSSAAGNAVLMAIASAYGVSLTDTQILRMNAKASVLAGISITGAYDDAAACLLGGAVFTDNHAMKVLKHVSMPPHLRVFIVLPPGIPPSSSAAFPLNRISPDDAYNVFSLAVNGDIMTAVRENGRMVANACGYSSEIADAAMDAGAVTAGVSGTGPAVGILVEPDTAADFLRRFPYKPALVTAIRNVRC